LVELALLALREITLNFQLAAVLSSLQMEEDIVALMVVLVMDLVLLVQVVVLPITLLGELL